MYGRSAPKSYVFDTWHKLASNMADQRIIYANGELRINGTKYQEVYSNQVSEDNFRLESVLDASGKTKKIYLKQEAGIDSIQISINDSLHFEKYYKYSGISVTEVTQADGLVLTKLSNSSNWEQQENETKIGSYVEKARTDWTIILVDDNGAGEIEIDVKNKVINSINKDDSRTKISDIIQFENRVINGVFK